jgi:hypothetical protein
MRYSIIVAIILIAVLIYETIDIVRQREAFTKLFQSGRAEYHKQKRSFRRATSDVTEGVKSQLKRTFRIAGF